MQEADPSEQDPDERLAALNPAQREAVRHPGGSLLVLAGAGSGKTRVITQRIAWLILERGVAPQRILAVTFTNKAAKEMRERVAALLGSDLAAWVGTFHALCLRILRRDAARAGLTPGFNVYDTDDQLALIKRILREEGPDAEGTPRSFLSRISRAKNALETPDDLAERAFTPEWKLTVQVWRAYQEALARAGALDFDDLLLRTIGLLRDDPELARIYGERCEQLLVDEYQDTNRPQYLLVRALSAVHGNVCVVGDEDQSIYRFRGAELRNILEFERDHPGTKVIRLEQNYRSTSTILGAANAVVSHNRSRLGKTLWTDNPSGDRIEFYRAPDDRNEAIWLARRVRELARTIPHREIAVLYRTNAQSRLCEEIFRRDAIPHQVVGAMRFYERKEIKDLLAYLRLAANPADDVSFRRVLNTPPRGIGEATLETVEQAAAASGQSLLAAARTTLAAGRIAARPGRMLAGFVDLMAEITERTEQEPVPALLEWVVRRIEYPAHLERAYGGELAADRLENVRALVSAAVDYTEEVEQPSLAEFLDRSALVSDADEVGREPGVTLMTVHNAKGLEYRVVFLIGLEENLFPHQMARATAEDIEEERRLCYVAMTRARERLLVACARFRRLQGNLLPTTPSRFLAEIPAELLDEQGPEAGAGFFEPVGTGYGGSSAARPFRGQQPKYTPRPAPAVTKPQPPTEPPDGYRAGQWVRHPSFGTGRILEREGAGTGLKLTIQFGDDRPRKIMVAYTKLLVEQA